MFENLTEKLNRTFKKLTNKGVLTEGNIAASLKEVKLAMLEADVNYRVVNAFLKSIKARALGAEVMKSLSPGQQVIKIVNDELIKMMGSENQGLLQESNQVSVVMMVGLQGSGKTTTAAKLANRLKKDGKKVHLVSADVYRPAAIEQLQVLAKDLGVPCFESSVDMNPADIAMQALQEAEAKMANYLILDTAGRLQIDETLMEELREIKGKISVKEILFVADAMTGQDAVNVAKTFHDKLSITGFVLTKMDGDARGGAALSIRAITGQPVKFVGIGEKIKDLEPFYPDRIASRILGMGDMVGLIEKAQEHFDETKAIKLEEKIRKNTFTLADFQDQLRQIRKMGSLTDIMGMIPGLGSKIPAGAEVDEKALVKIDAIISSMTDKERERPTIINGSRKLRISKGSGTKVNDINRLLKQFAQMNKMMKKFSSMGNSKKSMRALQNMMGSGGNMGPF
ncbi:MAG: signal recognition particle protein [Proteobacteria bacterium]|nr:signal recognition particle protein [Pseudomonadota bacterium]